MDAADLLGRHWPVVVVGGGQAGLSMSRCLGTRNVDHVVLERHQVAHSWKTYRWDTFCLVTPNWQCQLPDFPYAGDDPHGFMLRDQIVDYLEAYRRSSSHPLSRASTSDGSPPTSGASSTSTPPPAR